MTGARRSWAIRRSSVSNSNPRTWEAREDQSELTWDLFRGWGDPVEPSSERWRQRYPGQVRRRDESSRDRERVKRGARQLLYQLAKLVHFFNLPTLRHFAKSHGGGEIGLARSKIDHAAARVAPVAV